MNVYHVAGLCFVVWLGLLGELSVSSVAGGVATAVVGTLLFRRALGRQSSPATTSLRAAILTVPGFYLRFVLPGVLRGAWSSAWAPWRADRLAPAVLRLDLPGATDMSLTLLAHGITLSPSEQAVVIDDERQRLFVHVMDAPDPERRRAELLRAHERFLRGRV